MDKIKVQRTGTNFIINDVIVTSRTDDCILAYAVGPIQSVKVEFEFCPNKDGVWCSHVNNVMGKPIPNLEFTIIG